MAATYALQQAQPEPFLFTSEFQSALCPAIQRMRLPVGCGRDGGGAIAFFSNAFFRNALLPRSLPALIVACARHHSRKNAFPRSSLPTATFSSEPFVFLSSFVYAANPDVGNSVVHCCPRPSFTPAGAALNNGTMAATNTLAACAGLRLFCFHLFSFTFFLLFFLYFSFPRRKVQ